MTRGAAADRPDAQPYSRERNHRILVNVLRAPDRGGEDAPEAARPVAGEEWVEETVPDGIARALENRAAIVRDAVRGRIEAGRVLDDRSGHGAHLLQHVICHEGYHHGQIKLALQAAGTLLTDDVAGPRTWGVWMARTDGGGGGHQAPPPPLKFAQRRAR